MEKHVSLVTVAIAAYNVERFLEKGITFITEQTYRNLDIILVDDGSTDRTPELCDKIALQDPRIRVFHKKNGGLGSARNIGIDYARGEYLCFFDVDDSLDTDYIANSVHYAEEKNVDLVIYGYYARYEHSEQEELIALREREIHKNSELKEVFCEELLWMKHGNGFAWNKFYRVSFLKDHGFRFGNQRIQQDEPFNLQLYPELNHVYICPNAFYHYVLYNSGNAASRYLPNKAEIITDVYHRFVSFYYEWRLTDLRVFSYIQKRFISGIFGVATVNFFHEKCALSSQQRFETIDKIIHEREVVAVLRETKVGHGKNPLNALQAWAFNTGRTRTLIAATKLKRRLKRIVRL